jgi:hypothetical protein
MTEALESFRTLEEEKHASAAEVMEQFAISRERALVPAFNDTIEVLAQAENVGSTWDDEMAALWKYCDL